MIDQIRGRASQARDAAAGALASAESLTVCASGRWADAVAALSVVHDAYVEQGYSHLDESGLRVIAEYRNPGTTFLVCRQGDVAVGAMVVVPDGPFGLPSERAFPREIADLRERGVLHEVGSLAIAHSWRRLTRPIVQRLFAAMFLVWRGMPAVHQVIAIEPGRERFWVDAFNFHLAGRAEDHFGAPAVLLSVGRADFYRSIGEPRTSTQRGMNALARDPEAWFSDLRERRRSARGERPAAPVLQGAPRGA